MTSYALAVAVLTFAISITQAAVITDIIALYGRYNSTPGFVREIPGFTYQSEGPPPQEYRVPERFAALCGGRSCPGPQNGDQLYIFRIVSDTTCKVESLTAGVAGNGPPLRDLPSSQQGTAWTPEWGTATLHLRASPVLTSKGQKLVPVQEASCAALTAPAQLPTGYVQAAMAAPVVGTHTAMPPVIPWEQIVADARNPMVGYNGQCPPGSTQMNAPWPPCVNSDAWYSLTMPYCYASMNSDAPVAPYCFVGDTVYGNPDQYSSMRGRVTMQLAPGGLAPGQILPTGTASECQPVASMWCDECRLPGCRMPVAAELGKRRPLQARRAAAPVWAQARPRSYNSTRATPRRAPCDALKKPSGSCREGSRRPAQTRTATQALNTTTNPEFPMSGPGPLEGNATSAGAPNPVQQTATTVSNLSTTAGATSAPATPPPTTAGASLFGPWAASYTAPSGETWYAHPTGRVTPWCGSMSKSVFAISMDAGSGLWPVASNTSAATHPAGKQLCKRLTSDPTGADCGVVDTEILASFGPQSNLWGKVGWYAGVPRTQYVMPTPVELRTYNTQGFYAYELACVGTYL